MTVFDTNVYTGLTLIQSKFPDAAVRAELGRIHVPEALVDLFSGPEQSVMSTAGWVPDTLCGGYMYLFNGFIP